MYRVYNNQPYECYRETEITFDTYEEAMLFVYINYYYVKTENLWLENKTICDMIKENKFKLEDAKKAMEEDNERFFEYYDFECL